jgi:type III secretion protein J
MSVIQRLKRMSCPLFLALTVALLGGCTKQTELLGELTDQDANEAIMSLQSVGIAATKQRNKDGVQIFVPAASFESAVQELNARGLPREHRKSLGDVFRKEGMISTPFEDRVRYISGLSQELEETIGKIDGVVVARVHVVLPEQPEAGQSMQPASASVFIKYRPPFDVDAMMQPIRRLVLASVPGFSESTPDRVAVIFVPIAMPLAQPASQASSSPPVRIDLAIWGCLLLLAVIALGIIGGRFALRSGLAARLRQPAAPAVANRADPS